ncbi:type II secretion system protein GspM [Psychrobacter sp. DAB_AL43B]|uniref:type II secretion system protein GspM n=1 Tax=Psychrobacter sp. DAB_AL43B TaxID=1028416 RepID=UPI0009A668E5|nr:type II secretion system protein GspM [Psychrobacter sp. DAB_AL43B]SLJ84936.1 Type II secretion system, protein M [Psychrobacter sp. DAB_AL43B]
MKILQRFAKRNASMPRTSVLSARMTGYQSLLSARWQALSPRDQLALIALSAFLLLFGGGYGGYSVHQAANNSKSEYHEQVADYFWLRAQAANIDSNALNAANPADGTAALPPASSVSTLLNNTGIVDAQVIANGDAVQLSFNHASQAVVSTALGKLEQQGWQFTQLSMQQDLITKAIQVQATVTS